MIIGYWFSKVILRGISWPFCPMGEPFLVRQNKAARPLRFRSRRDRYDIKPDMERIRITENDLRAFLCFIYTLNHLLVTYTGLLLRHNGLAVQRWNRKIWSNYSFASRSMFQVIKQEYMTGLNIKTDSMFLHVLHVTWIDSITNMHYNSALSEIFIYYLLWEAYSRHIGTVFCKMLHMTI
jgi:hypothetical protein